MTLFSCSAIAAVESGSILDEVVVLGPDSTIEVEGVLGPGVFVLVGVVEPSSLVDGLHSEVGVVGGSLIDSSAKLSLRLTLSSVLARSESIDFIIIL